MGDEGAPGRGFWSVYEFKILRSRVWFVASLALALVASWLWIELRSVERAAREASPARLPQAPRAGAEDGERKYRELKQQHEMTLAFLGQLEGPDRGERTEEWQARFAKALGEAAARSEPDPSVRVGFKEYMGRFPFATSVPPEELAHLRSIVEASGDPRMRLALAGFLEGAERVEALEQVVRTDPGNLRAHLALGEAMLGDPARKGRWEEALRRARELDPDNAYVDEVEALGRVHLGDDEGAVESLLRASGKSGRQDLLAAEISWKEDLLRKGGWSEGPRRAQAFLGSLVGGGRLPIVSAQRSLSEKAAARAEALEREGRGAEALEAWEALERAGLRAGRRTAVEELVGNAIRQKALARIEAIRARAGDAERAAAARRALEALERRQAAVRAATKALGEPEAMARMLAGDAALAGYFEFVLRNGEVDGVRTHLGFK